MPSMAGGGEGPGAVIFMILGLVVGVVVAGGFYYTTNKESNGLAKKIEAANADGTRLQGIKVKYEQRRKEADAFERRVKVIDQLRADQKGPVDLLTNVGQMVNNTDAVWLSNMNENGNTVNITGTALSTNAVANLMANLKRSGYFKTVEIKSAAQDPAVKEMTAFNFVLVCEKQPKT